MKQSVYFSDFCDAFRDSGRNDSFTYAGKRALFDYLEQYEEDCQEEIELDVVALCCEYSEHESALACLNDLGYDFVQDEDDDEEDQEEAALAYLQDNAGVIVFDGGVIIQGF
jgi:hypothetical protein